MKSEQLLEASTTINLYYNNPEWQSIVQDLHKRYGLSPNIPWEEVENKPQHFRVLYEKLKAKSKIKPFVPTVYLLLYDNGLILLGNPSSKAPTQSVYAFGYHFDSKQGRKTEFWPATFEFTEQGPIRAVYETPLSLRSVITRPEASTVKKTRDQSRIEIDHIKKNIFRFLLPLMEKYVNRAMADIEGIIIQYIRSGNYNAARNKVDHLQSLSDIRDLLTSSRPLRTSNELTNLGLRLYNSDFMKAAFNNALGYYRADTVISDIDSIEWLKSIQTDRTKLSGLLQHFYEQLI